MERDDGHSTWSGGGVDDERFLWSEAEYLRDGRDVGRLIDG